MFKKIQEQTKKLKKQVLVLYLTYKHPDVQWYKKAFLFLVLIYAVSPIDLIPDFIPVLGFLDDLIIIPLGIIIALKMIPKPIWDECQAKVESGIGIDSKYKTIGALMIITIWALVILLIVQHL